MDMSRAMSGRSLLNHSKNLSTWPVAGALWNEPPKCAEAPPAPMMRVARAADAS